jgi:nicotinate-nucleotide pyrophosphorylase (carboxylating)
MSVFTLDEAAACQRLIQLALEEDLGHLGDLTSDSVIPPDLEGQAVVVARATGVVAGLPAAEMVLAAVEPRLQFQPLVGDGTAVRAGNHLANARGPMRGILTSERTALNFLQHLSGIATLTRRFVEAIAGLPCSILDTRKTTPGWRLLEKYAVRQGGGHNHRMGLYDGVLIKDNHLAALRKTMLDLAEVVSGVRAKSGDAIEVEVDTLEQLDLALACSPYCPNIILLDNMTLDELREAVRRRKQVAPDVSLEASGGVTLSTVRAIAETGVDRISVGALTHSAPALDIALDYQT